MNDSTAIGKPMNVVEKFALLFTKEPQKSFRKANITDGNDLLTGEGAKVFLSWLLTAKYADEFNKEVVAKILKDLEKKN